MSLRKTLLTLVLTWTHVIYAVHDDNYSRLKDSKSSLRGRGHDRWKDDVCHEMYQNADECDADPQCSWCECSAIPSSCYSVDAIDNLPAGVFDCHKKPPSALEVSRVAKEIAVELNDDGEELVATAAGSWLKCWMMANEKDCLGGNDDHSDCSWCTIANPVGAIVAICEPLDMVDRLIDSGYASKCTSAGDPDDDEEMEITTEGVARII